MLVHIQCICVYGYHASLLFVLVMKNLEGHGILTLRPNLDLPGRPGKSRLVMKSLAEILTEHEFVWKIIWNN